MLPEPWDNSIIIWQDGVNAFMRFSVRIPRISLADGILLALSMSQMPSQIQRWSIPILGPHIPFLCPIFYYCQQLAAPWCHSDQWALWTIFWVGYPHGNTPEVPQTCLARSCAPDGLPRHHQGWWEVGIGSGLHQGMSYLMSVVHQMLTCLYAAQQSCFTYNSSQCSSSANSWWHPRIQDWPC